MGYTLLDDSGAPAKGVYTLLPDSAPAPKAKPFGQQLNDAIADVPRQVGLTGRYFLEGVGGAFDSLVGNPVRTLAAPILGNAPRADTGGTAADLLGLPKPQTAQERVVGDATRTLAGGALPLGAAGALAGRTSGVTQGVARALAANPAQQLASAAAAGGAGGYTRETEGNGTSQFLASLAAGVAAPLAMGGTQAAIGAAARRFAPAAQTPQQAAQIDITINNALQDSGLKLDQLAPQVAQSIRNDVAAAFNTNKQVSPDAVRRLADYRLTGLTPTAAGLTLDPAIVTQQKNLAKLGINSKDQVAQQLGQTQNANNRGLTTGLNNLGAATSDDSIAGASKIIDALNQRNQSEQNIIGSYYEQARDSAGRSAPLDPHAFTQRAGDLLNESNVESFLTPDIRNKLNGFADGSIPLTVDIAEQFKTGIGRVQRNASDGNVRHALGLVRQALDETPLLQPAAPQQFGGSQMTAPGGLGAAAPATNIGQDAIDAFNKARGANRDWMRTVESTPALQAVRDGVEPDKFVQQFIVGSGTKASVMDVAQLKNQIKDNPDAMEAVRTQIASYLKQRALNGAADEVGNFSQSGYNSALNGIGERKLKLFFSDDAINRMKALGRVASYEQFQPAGSAVNNSNTAGAVGAIADRFLSSGLLSKIPFGKQVIADPLENIMLGVRAGRSLDVPSSITLPGTRVPSNLLRGAGLGLSPAALLPTETEEERRRRLLLSSGG